MTDQSVLAESAAAADLAERLAWLLRLRWLVVPAFVVVDLASDLLLDRGAPWTALVIGGALLSANGLCVLLLSRRPRLVTLLAWVRIESALVVSIPVVIVLLHGDPRDPLRYGVLVGVVGAAAVLPRTAEVAVVGMWAVASLIIADVLAFRFDALQVTNEVIARWAMEAGIVATVSALACYLHSRRQWTQARLEDSLAKLERSRIEWEATFESLHEMLVVTDLEGVVLRANRAFAQIAGMRPHECAGRALSELLAGHPDRWWNSRSSGIVEIEDPVFDSLFEVTAARVGDRWVRVARDVGEQRRLYVRLVQADKLAAVGVLASGVVHDINNPSAAVTSNLTELRRYLSIYEGLIADLNQVGMQAGTAERVSALEQKPEVSFARRESPRAVDECLLGMERIGQIVANLGSLARREQAGEPAGPVSLQEVIEAVLRSAAPELRNATAQVDLRDQCWVLGHRGELIDVVLNLVVNAIQAREEGRPNRIGVELRREGAHAVIRVSDTGRGIGSNAMKRLFEPPFAARRPGEGTGLGLALARNIVLAHGGSIDVASESGVGSNFTVRLPAVEPDAQAMGWQRASV